MLYAPASRVQNTGFPNVNENKLPTERRKWPRARVRWELQFLDVDIPHCVTRDISSGGFFFVCGRALNPGDCLNCVVSIPAHRAHTADSELLMYCRVEIVRVERDADRLYGTACRILDYRTRGCAFSY